MPQYILALDQGTTGSTALLIDEKLSIKASASYDFKQHFPKPFWVEHDLEDIWTSMCLAIKEVVRKSRVNTRQIVTIGITNQRETTCLWERKTLKPFGKAIVWQDRRTASYCDKLKARGLEEEIRKKTGLFLDPYFSVTKLIWMLDTGARSKINKLIFGTIDSYLLFRMTGNHATDPSNASRTLLMNLLKCEWDKDLLKLFKIPSVLLPEIKSNATTFGNTKGVPSLPDGIPITGIAGDQQAALFGQACFAPGSVKCTYGTGAFILANVGKKPVLSKHRLISSVAWKLNGETTYCLEGSAFVAGAAVQWIRDGLGLIEETSQLEKLALSVKDSDGIVFVPALSGMGAPHWLSNAKGLITGLSRRTNKAHIARATLEGVAFQVQDLLKAMTADLKNKLVHIKVDGGASQSDLLMQFQADLARVPIIRSKVTETTALGVGLQAGLAVGMWKDLDEISSKWKSAEKFSAKCSVKDRNARLYGWDEAMKAVTMLSSQG